MSLLPSTMGYLTVMLQNWTGEQVNRYRSEGEGKER